MQSTSKTLELDEMFGPGTEELFCKAGELDEDGYGGWNASVTLLRPLSEEERTAVAGKLHDCTSIPIAGGWRTYSLSPEEAEEKFGKHAEYGARLEVPCFQGFQEGERQPVITFAAKEAAGFPVSERLGWAMSTVAEHFREDAEQSEAVLPPEAASALLGFFGHEMPDAPAGCFCLYREEDESMY